MSRKDMAVEYWKNFATVEEAIEGIMELIPSLAGFLQRFAISAERGLMLLVLSGSEEHHNLSRGVQIVARDGKEITFKNGSNASATLTLGESGRCSVTATLPTNDYKRGWKRYRLYK